MQGNQGSMNSYKHQGNRRRLVEKLRTKGIEDEAVLSAMGKIPRHLFMDSAFEDFAYEDKAFPIAAHQTISHPSTVALQTQLLHVQPGEKVLEIGTGSGYQTMVLMEMGAQVYTIERQKELVDFSRRIFEKLGKRPRHQTFGDGYKGLTAFAPFHKIIVTAGAPSIPTRLLPQLEIGGLAVIPIGDKEQKMFTFLRMDEKKYEQMEFGDFRFVPMLQSKEI